MRPSLPLTAVALAGAALLALPAAGAGLFSTEISHVVKSGEKATLTIHPDSDYIAMELTLTRVEDDAPLSLVKKGIKKGKKVVFSWSVPDGEWNYTGTIKATWKADEVFVLPMDFRVVAAGPLKIEVPRDKLKLGDRTVTAKVNRAAARGTVELIGLEGVIETVDEEFPYSEPDEELEFSWSTGSEVIKMTVKVWDIHGFMAFEEITPWSLSIPHEDVIFETGSDVIRASEEHKLKHAADQVQDVINKYGHIVNVRLYIAGYTDTVGSEADNRALSLRRAKSIAAWFRRAGFSIPIYYQGFGENALAVPTDDNVDLAANRRALYVLGANHPHGPSFPGSNWQKL